MELQIYRTEDGTRSYPLHRHTGYEVMLYLEGTGHLRTGAGDIPFAPGTIVIVPPGMEHGSVSTNGFRNISVCGDFGHAFRFTGPAVCADTPQGEGRKLAEILYGNRYGNREYLTRLAEAYICFLLQNLQPLSGVEASVHRLAGEISGRAFDSDLRLKTLLESSGYAEDYIRDRFRRAMGRTPTEYLTEIRIRRACFLIDVYGGTVPMAEVAQQCGFTDYACFSKKFRARLGLSPSAYRRSVMGK